MIEKIKTWFKNKKNRIVTGVAVGVALVVAFFPKLFQLFTGWRQDRRVEKKLEESRESYEQKVEVLEQKAQDEIVTVNERIDTRLREAEERREAEAAAIMAQGDEAVDDWLNDFDREQRRKEKAR